MSPQPKKKSKIEEYADAVQAQQTAVLDAREEMGQELLDHMMQLPSVAAAFSDEDDQEMFREQLVFFMDGALRAQRERAHNREQMAAIGPAGGGMAPPEEQSE